LNKRIQLADADATTQTPLTDLAASLDIIIPAVGEDLHYDDPSLALLFSQLKSKTLQTAKGASEIPEGTEFNFILQMARVFCRMGMMFSTNERLC
jgi:hypothetical protein